MRISPLIFIVIFATGCGSMKSSFNPQKKYSPQQLEKDYTVFENLLEESHPGLYWYTSKDSMDYYFSWGKQKIKDSLTEPEFRKVLSYVISKMNCGHTTVRSSKKYSRYLDTLRIEKFFPLSLKLWDDTTVVAANLNRRDSVLKRGTVIEAIDHKPLKEITDTLFKFISSDGYNLSHKFQSLSNRGVFGSLYSSVYGMPSRYTIDYSDSIGKKHSVTIPVYDPSKDTANRIAIRRFIRPTKKERKKMNLRTMRSLRMDTARQIAFLDVNSFGRGYQLKRFFRQSFHTIHKHNVKNLVIDVRGNGGGSVTNSTLLSKYLANHKFKVCDSLYAINRHSRYRSYIKKYFFNRLFMLVFTRKKQDGHFHFTWFENHCFKPKQKNHFNGKSYILIGGNSFSATTLFTNSIITQSNVIVVGEETGGGAYGNTAWLIPDVKLPETKLQFRLPLFRLVMDRSQPKTGHGIMPEVEVKPNVDAIRRNADYKLDKVMQLIKEASSRPSPKEKATNAPSTLSKNSN
jgi:C-terminal processing protease CtpA/Prc